MNVKWNGPMRSKAARRVPTPGRPVFLVSRLELLSFAIVLAVMVFKPGA